MRVSGFAARSAVAGVVIAGAIAAIALTAAAAAPAAPIVSIADGQLQGVALEGHGGAVFKGIPFAAPPVGDLRWREPQPVIPWTGVRRAVEYGNACAQALAGWNRIAFDRSSEDCLYLNVWTPQWPVKATAGKPVMVWIHGGGNSGGSAIGAGGIEPPFDGASLARHGVVVVTLNYRLGVFGFVGHPELTAESPHHASGEYGILDQVAALRWVRDNIARFGGDPNNVTVFGQSAGAQDTTILVASPLTRGLIAKAIAQSGSPMISDRHLLSPAQTEQLGVVLAQTLKAPSKDQIRYLRALSTGQILAASAEFRKGLAAAQLNLDVGQDGYAVPTFSALTYKAGQEPAIPMIVGNNARDIPGYRPPDLSPEALRAQLKTHIDAMYGKYADLDARVSKAYGFGGDGAGISDYAPYGPVDLQFAVDHSFRCQATAIARWHSAIAPTYEYEFTAGVAAHPPMHSGELDFVFGYLRDQAAAPKLKTLSAQMQDYWTNFAKTGDPNGPGLPVWPRYDPQKRGYMQLSNDGAEARADLRPATCPLYVEKLNRDLSGAM
ncbi:MAG TPA: carboxylesterase family protein [Caulobacteraceae bacterium]|nr:carboxylesterase family protein [Caulobacteraceae bacterium]